VHQISTLPESRRAAIKQQLDALKKLPDAERERALESPEVKNKFTPQERELIDNASAVLPDQF